MSFPNFNPGAIFGLLLLSGCSAPGGLSFFTGSGTGEKSSSATPKEADTCPTPEKCAAQLRKIINDPKRDWVGQVQPPDSYANGTRLFAYRALRKKLSCNELKRALEETNAAMPSLEPARYTRLRALITDVARELRVEHGNRCRPRA